MSRIDLSTLPSSFDAIVIGGGITGAGILREAVRTGAKVLLVEQNDFASGTSSASSKLVHGGLRYLKNGQWKLTLESVRERQRLLREAPGLVEAQPFLMPLYRGAKPGKFTMRVGLWIYDLMAGTAASGWLSQDPLLKIEPHLRKPDLLGAVHYEDARTDDARLVQRLIRDAVTAGAVALNYVRADVQRVGEQVTGVRLIDALSGRSREISSKMVINASGAWAADLPGAPAGSPKLRPLRGSHFVFSTEKLPVQKAVSWLHPKDQRPIFAYPWEGAVVYGTTDLDHDGSQDHPRMTREEADYLLDGLAYQFPSLQLKASDAISTYSGVRPIVASGKDDPSAESRESAMWSSPGMVNITGGKLTTFRVTAREVLREAARQVPVLEPARDEPVFEIATDKHHQRLFGRFGSVPASTILGNASSAELESVAGSVYSWAELRWSARHEQVEKLDDLLMRRTRIGLVVKDGARDILPRVKKICMAELAWDEARWNAEATRYLELWQRNHAPVMA
ncbi:MAG: glycerol-3-phosphate dehydrogenase/oxidase [Rhizobium sp.]|nr:MAG: glycerol-3-phosphate dehydrogenase/oxidase [Rhizobium sp.]